MSSSTAPIISATGISAPTFAQIYAYFQSQYQSIFGNDALVTPDTQDGQLLAVFAQAISDANSAAIAVYNSFSPATAQGVGLSNNVQINGLQRLIPTASVATVTLTGAPGAIISNGQVIDQSNNLWSLPASVTIASNGLLITTVTCQVLGAINVTGSTAFTINTPTFGWTGVFLDSVVVGNPAETDAALRVRQAQSVALPSVTIFEGIVAAIENVPGVTRTRGYENNTSNPITLPTDSGVHLPPNTLAFVVEGGAQSPILNAIFEKITPGIPTWGPSSTSTVISQVITDTNGSTRLISYIVAFEGTVNVAITVHPLAGWSTTTIPLIQAAVAAYFNSLPIGGLLSYFSMIPVISLLGTPQAGTFEITAMTLNGGANDIQFGFNTAFSGSLSPVTVAVV